MWPQIIFMGTEGVLLKEKLKHNDHRSTTPQTTANIRSFMLSPTAYLFNGRLHVRSQ